MKIQTKSIIVGSILDTGRELSMDGDENLLQFGNKAYYIGGGWWRISDSGGQSVKKTLTAIDSLTRVGKKCVECGRLHICNNRCMRCIQKSSPTYW